MYIDTLRSRRVAAYTGRRRGSSRRPRSNIVMIEKLMATSNIIQINDYSLNIISYNSILLHYDQIKMIGIPVRTIHELNE